MAASSCLCLVLRDVAQVHLLASCWGNRMARGDASMAVVVRPNRVAWVICCVHLRMGWAGVTEPVVT